MNNDILNEIESELLGKESGTAQVHIRIQQRNARKRITTVEGLDDDLDLKKILKAMKKKFSCNGNVEKSEEYGMIIKMSGDQRETVKNFLADYLQITNVKLHG